MPRLARLVAATLAVAATAPLAAPAQAPAAWPARTVAIDANAFHRGVAGLPGGRVATLLERQSGATHSLELWVGERRTVIDQSRHTFDARVAADSRGAIVVSYARVLDTGGPRQAFAWTGGRPVQLMRSSRSVSTTELDVAPDGRAIVAFSVGAREVWVTRRSSGGPFTQPARVFAGAGAYPVQAGIGDDGTATVAWGANQAVGLARAQWGGQFGAPVTVPARRRSAFAMDVLASGAAVLAIKRTTGDDSAGYDRSVSVSTWPSDEADPTTLTPLSEEQAGTPAVLARDGRAFVVWREGASRTAPGRLAVAVVDAEGTPDVSTWKPRGGAGSALGAVQLAPAGATGVRVYFTAGGALRTAAIDDTRRLGAASTAIATSTGGGRVAATQAGGRPVVVWTQHVRGARHPYRLRIARP